MLGFGRSTSSRFSRVIYADDPVLVLGHSGAERAYGARLLIVPTGAAPPPRPRGVRGTVVHLDPAEDPHWIRGDENPMLDWLLVKERVGSHVPGVGDIDDRWHEYRFLNAVAPGLASPRTELASRYTGSPASAEELAAARQAVAPRIASATERGPYEDLVRLEVVRRRIHAELGASLVKGRGLCASEGRLPSTADDWPQLYLRYLTRTRDTVERLRQQVEGSSATLESRIRDLPHVKGRVLELILAEPESVVVQRVTRIHKEVRVHVVDGRILEGATFLRFYPVGQYLLASEVDHVHRAVQRDLLNALPPELSRFSCSADVIFEEGGRNLSIIDLNGGLESGYYFPEEDLFTTNLLASHFLGHPTRVLEEFEAMMERAPGAARAARVLRFRKSFAKIMTGDVQEAFWDRVLVYHAEAIQRQPDGAALDAALEELAASGLDRPPIFHQLIAWAQDAFPALALSRERLAVWVDRLQELSSLVRTYAAGGRLYAAPAEERQRKPRERVAPLMVPLAARS